MRGLVTYLTWVRREAVLYLGARMKLFHLSLNAFEGSSHRGCMFTFNDFKSDVFFLFFPPSLFNIFFCMGILNFSHAPQWGLPEQWTT